MLDTILLPPGVLDVDDGFDRHCVAQGTDFCFWPRRCYASSRWIFLRHAFRRTAVWYGPGDMIFEDRWYHPHEAAVMMLKGK